MYRYAGKILRVNLTEGKVKIHKFVREDLTEIIMEHENREKK